MTGSFCAHAFFIAAALLVAFIVYNSCLNRSPRGSSRSKTAETAARHAEMSAFVEDFLARFPAEFADAELRAKAYDDDLLRCYTRAARKGYLNTRDENNRNLPIGFPHFCAVDGQKHLELMVKRLNTLDSNLVSDEILAQARQAAAIA